MYITECATERIPMWYKCFFAEEQFIIAIPKLVKVCEFAASYITHLFEEDEAELQLSTLSHDFSLEKFS